MFNDDVAPRYTFCFGISPLGQLFPQFIQNKVTVPIAGTEALVS